MSLLRDLWRCLVRLHHPAEKRPHLAFAHIELAQSSATIGPFSAALGAFLHDEHGQVLPMVALAMFVLLGMAGLAVTSATSISASANCRPPATPPPSPVPPSSPPPPRPPQSSLRRRTTAPSPAEKTSTPTWARPRWSPAIPSSSVSQACRSRGISCVGYLPYNALQVREIATVPMYFAKLFGKSTMTVSASSTAAKGGGSSRPYNIAIMLDTTLSMDYYDADCGATQMKCSLNGVQVLLKYLDPCGTSQQTCTITSGNSLNSVVRVSLFTFPQIQYPTLSNDTTCSNSPASAWSYTFPLIGAVGYYPGAYNTSTTYQVTPFQSDYRLSDTATLLNSGSSLVTAAGGVSGCAGLQTPNYAGYFGTYYGATMYAAQSALVAQQLANPGSQNVLIILGDGDANAPQYNPPGNPNGVTVMSPPATGTGLYPSYYGECGQAMDAATFATGQGTTVYTVAYGSPSSGCTTDQTNQGHVGGDAPQHLPL